MILASITQNPESLCYRFTNKCAKKKTAIDIHISDVERQPVFWFVSFESSLINWFQSSRMDTGSLFTIEINDEPLSVKTILEHHRLISTILKLAEKEMIVQYNAAARATPLRLAQKEAESLQPEEVEAIRDALEAEPLKWKVATHLLLVSGCRRGEIAGLMWDKVDWDNNQIKIDQASLYSRTAGVYEDTTKTITTRFIKLPVETMQLLREYKTWIVGINLQAGGNAVTGFWEIIDFY